MTPERLAELEARVDATRAPNTDPIERVDALVNLAWTLRSTDTKRCYALASEARTLAIDHGYRLGQARAARTMAMSAFSADAIKQVLTLADEAKRLFDEVGDDAGRAGARDYLASLYEFVGDLAGGMDLALEALSIARAANDPIRQGYALSSVGGILTESGDFDEAIERLTEALHLFESVDAHDGVGAICSRLATACRRAGRVSDARRYIDRCVEVAKVTHNDFLRMAAVSASAEIEHGCGNLETAESLYRQSIDCLDEPVRSVVCVEQRVALARVLMARGKLDAAEAELLATIQSAYELSVVGIASAHQAMADLFERKGDLRNAIHHLKKVGGLKEQIALRDARNKRAQVEARAAMDAAKERAKLNEQRYVELHAMQAKLVQAERMAVLGRLAAGTAHEINTPLGVLRSHSALVATAIERLLCLLPDGATSTTERLTTAFEESQRANDAAIARIAAIADSFKRFSQLDQADLRMYDVNEGLDSALALLAPTVPSRIEIERVLRPVPPIRAWPRAINHAFMTTLENAIQAIDENGTVTAETSATRAHVVIRIRDTGRGMSAEQVANLFDVTLSSEGPRTAMRFGLSAAYATVRDHGGTLTVDSSLGAGTTLTFQFPISIGSR